MDEHTRKILAAVAGDAVSDDLWKVEIVRRSDGAVEHTLAPEGKPQRVAERLENGVSINLDHARFKTRIVRVVDASTKKAGA